MLKENEDCPQTEWSSWSPCSASCGKGKRIRVLLSVEDENDAKLTSSDDCPQVDTIEEQDCFDLPSCDMYEELYRGRYFIKCISHRCRVRVVLQSLTQVLEFDPWLGIFFS